MGTLIGRRLANLEARYGITPPATMHVVVFPEGWDSRDALAAVGVEPAESDLVVFLRTFAPGTPELVSSNPIDGDAAAHRGDRA